MKKRKFTLTLKAMLRQIGEKLMGLLLLAPMALAPALAPIAVSAEEADIEEVVVTGVR